MYSVEQIQVMDEKANRASANWSFAALGANLLPPPFDMMAVGTVFAKMGARLGDIYEERVAKTPKQE